MSYARKNVSTCCTLNTVTTTVNPNFHEDIQVYNTNVCVHKWLVQTT